MNIKLYHYTDKNIKNKIKVKYFAENFYTNNDKKASNTKRSFFFTNKNIPEGEPLDYTYSIFMLVGLGVIGLIFAILLKREDKTSGFGLELPNKNN